MSLGIAYSNSTQGSTGQAGPWDITGWTIPTCNKLIVFVGIGDNPLRAPSSVTWNSVAMTLIATADDANYCGCSAYYLDSPSVGNYTLSFGLPESATDIMACLVALTDAETGAPAYNTATPSSAAPSVTVAGSANGDLLIGAIMSDSSGSVVKGSTLTQLFAPITSTTSDTEFHAEYKTATGASAVADWTQTSGLCACIAVAVGGTGGGPTYTLMGQACL